MRKTLISLLIITLTLTTSCGLLSTYDDVQLIIGLEIPIYTQNVSMGMKLTLKDQAIGKIEKNQKMEVMNMYLEVLKWKTNQEN